MGRLLQAAIAAAEERWEARSEELRRAFEDDCERLLGPDLAEDMGLVFGEAEVMIELADGAAGVPEEEVRSAEQRLLDLVREVVREELRGF